MISLIQNLCLLSLGYLLLFNFFRLVRLAATTVRLKRYVRSLKYSDHRRYAESDNIAPISILIYATKDEPGLVNTVSNLLTMVFLNYEVIVICDSDSASSLSTLTEKFNLLPLEQPFKRLLNSRKVNAVYRSCEDSRLIVIDKTGQGKADAYNCGINLSSFSIFMTVDVGCYFDKASLTRIAYAFLSDPQCIAVGGITRIDNNNVPKSKPVFNQLKNNLFSSLVATEAFYVYLKSGMDLATLGLPLMVWDRFAAYNKTAVVQVGGYKNKIHGESSDLLLNLHKVMREQKRPYSMRLLPDPICFIPPYTDLHALKMRQKHNAEAMTDALISRRSMVFNSHYGIIGMVSLPLCWFFEVFGYFIESFGYLLLPIACITGSITPSFALSYYCVSVLFEAVISSVTLLSEENAFTKDLNLIQLMQLILPGIVNSLSLRYFYPLSKAYYILSFLVRKSLNKV